MYVLCLVLLAKRGARGGPSYHDSRDLVFATALLLSFQFEEENDVIIMTDDNFEALIAENGPTFVEFYAPVCLHPATAIVCVSSCPLSFFCFYTHFIHHQQPKQWCGYCKKLTPEFEAAAAELKTLDPPMRIAKVC